MQDKSPEAAKVAKKILDWAQQHFTFVDWRGVSFVPKLDYGAESTHNPITVYGMGKIPRVGIKFGRMKYRNGFSVEKRRDLLNRLNAIPGVKIRLDAIDKHPMIPLATLTNDDSLKQFFETITWTIEQVKKNASHGSSAVYGRGFE